MIIVHLKGGLGNQMFQYAAGRRLAHHHDTHLFLDTSWFASSELRHYQLEIFKIQADLASSNLLKNVKYSQKYKIFKKVFSLLTGSPQIMMISRQSPDFHVEVLSLPDNAYLDGYWQSEKYFEDIYSIIKSDFSFKNSPDTINLKTIREIQKSNSISLHIRRGDYYSEPKINDVYGVVGLQYYVDAYDAITKLVEKPQFFVFSDDIQWAKNNLHLDVPLHFIDNNIAGNSYEDLRLMSYCKHHIIANSTFSWWGAWLSNAPDKIVIAPQKWYNVTSYNTRDLIPDTWIRI